MSPNRENRVALARSENYRADLAARLKLVSLNRITPARMSWLVGRRDPVEVVSDLIDGCFETPPAGPAGSETLIRNWSQQVRRLDGQALIDKQLEAGAGFLTPLDTRWPFFEDPDPPLMVFVRGNVLLLDQPRAVAVVGTRRCTSVGRQVAHDFGQGLARVGLNVVSGLALGIDSSAHRGTLDHGGGAIAVVGSGVDVVYPKTNTGLWGEVAKDGLLMSEYLCGTGPAKWHFPARNRLIAALADGVVVVESHDRGGSLLTANEAADRGKPVFAVPGSVLSSASHGTNALLVDGAIPARDAVDVLTYLGCVEADDDEGMIEENNQVDRLSDDCDDWMSQLVLQEVSQGPVHLDILTLAAGVRVDQMIVLVRRLVEAGRVSLAGSTVSLGS